MSRKHLSGIFGGLDVVNIYVSSTEFCIERQKRSTAVKVVSSLRVTVGSVRSAGRGKRRPSGPDGLNF